jgi:arylsulfatase
VLASAPTVACALLLLVGLHGADAALAGHRSRPRLNVLLVTIDTLRADHLGAYGYDRATSPHIDALARESVLFSRAQSPWPLTTPSFAAMLTGTYGHTNGIMRTTGQRLPDRALTLAELLRAGGYRTLAAVGNVNLASVFNFDQGFDRYLELWREHDDARTRVTTARGLDLLRSAAASAQPFFLWVHFFDPHARYRPPSPYDHLFVGDAYYDPSRRAPLHVGRRDDMGGIPASVALGHEDHVAYYVAQYDGEIRYVDEQVGRLLAGLSDTGLADRTLVVLTADHGESLGDHDYYFEHGRLPYDDCAHVPLIVRAPGVGRAGSRIAAPVGLVDLLPTVLDLAGLPADDRAEGHSLRRLLESGDAGTPPSFAFTESGFARDYQRSITGSRYKLVFVPDAGDRRLMTGRRLELYDLAADPGETRNVLDEHPEIAAELEHRLFRWMREAGPGAAPPPPVGIDALAAGELRSLGYAD